MQSTSALYQQIVSGVHWVETKVVIGGRTYNESSIYSMSTSARVFKGDAPSIGGCLAREIDIKMVVPKVNPPRRAKIEPYVRVVNGTSASEWLPKGKYYIDTRDTDNDLNVLTIHGFDDVIRMEADYAETDLDWPAKDIDVVNEIVGFLGISIESSTLDLLTKEFEVQLPTLYTYREILEFIAGMYGGNFIMSEAGELRLIRFRGNMEETSLLITEDNYKIVIGGVRLRV